MSRGNWQQRIGRSTAACLLSLVLCLGSVGDLLAANLLAQAAFPFPGEICHSPGSGEQDGGKAEPRAAHDCCVVCHVLPDQQLAPPAIAVIGPVGPARPVVFTPDAATAAPNPSSLHKNARAPPGV